jgi:FKBP-type peptidyl-prolyl cis-trans isomerase 2
MKKITGFAVIKDNIGNRVTYTYTEIDDQGNIVDSNKKESFVVMDTGTEGLIKQLEEVINTRLI